MYAESVPENISYPNLFTVKCPFRILSITRVQKSTMKSRLGGGGAPGAYLAHGLIGYIIHALGYNSCHLLPTVSGESAKLHNSKAKDTEDVLSDV